MTNVDDQRRLLLDTNGRNYITNISILYVPENLNIPAYYIWHFHMLISGNHGRRKTFINYWFSGIYLYDWPLKLIICRPTT